jgi:hypothetical protein
VLGIADLGLRIADFGFKKWVSVSFTVHCSPFTVHRLPRLDNAHQLNVDSREGKWTA